MELGIYVGDVEISVMLLMLLDVVNMDKVVCEYF